MITAIVSGVISTVQPWLESTREMFILSDRNSSKGTSTMKRRPRTVTIMTPRSVISYSRLTNLTKYRSTHRGSARTRLYGKIIVRIGCAIAITTLHSSARYATYTLHVTHYTPIVRVTRHVYARS